MGTPQSTPPPGLDALNDSPFPLEPTATDAQQAIKEEFGFFGDWSERYQYLIDLGRKLPDFPDEWKIEQHRLLGCQSMVWIVPSGRSEEHTSELQSLMRISYAVFCLKKKTK